jgi:hypothetical protein
MDVLTGERFIVASRELQDFLQRAEGLTNGASTVTEEGIVGIWVRLLELAPEVEEANRSGRATSDSGDEIGNYIRHLRLAREALEKVRCVMLARSAKLEVGRRQISGLQGWINAYRQTT